MKEALIVAGVQLNDLHQLVNNMEEPRPKEVNKPIINSQKSIREQQNRYFNLNEKQQKLQLSKNRFNLRPRKNVNYRQ